MNSPSTSPLTPTQRVTAATVDRYTPFGLSEGSQAQKMVHADFALSLASDLELAQLRIVELDHWKSEMLEVCKQLDDHKLAEMLGAKVGNSTFEVINKRVPEVLEELTKAKAIIKELRNENTTLKNHITGITRLS